MDQTVIEKQTYEYLNAKDAGNYPNAYSMFTNSMKAATSFESWQASARDFNSKSGRVKSRRVVKVALYKDPPSAPELGIYATADYVSKFENIDIHCGYVAWYQDGDGTFRVIREEQNFVDKATQARMRNDELENFKTKFGCAVR